MFASLLINGAYAQRGTNRLRNAAGTRQEPASCALFILFIRIVARSSGLWAKGPPAVAHPLVKHTIQGICTREPALAAAEPETNLCSRTQNKPHSAVFLSLSFSLRALWALVCPFSAWCDKHIHTWKPVCVINVSALANPLLFCVSINKTCFSCNKLLLRRFGKGQDSHNIL